MKVKAPTRLLKWGLKQCYVLNMLFGLKCVSFANTIPTFCLVHQMLAQTCSKKKRRKKRKKKNHEMSIMRMIESEIVILYSGAHISLVLDVLKNHAPFRTFQPICLYFKYNIMYWRVFKIVYISPYFPTLDSRFIKT